MNIKINKNILIINGNNISIDNLIIGNIYKISNIGNNKILLLEKYNELYICVYQLNNNINYILDSIEKIYKKLVKVYQISICVGMNQNKLSIKSISYIYNPFSLLISSKKLYITDNVYKNIKIKEYTKKPNILKLLFNNRIYNYKFNIDEIINDETSINNIMRISINVNNVDVNFSLNKIGIKKKPKMYYVPIKSIYKDKYAMNIRRSSKGKLIFIKRLKEDIEFDKKFLFRESKIISYLLRFFGGVSRIISFKKVNICFEKMSEKAEEGTFELCKKMQQSKIAKSYFIIDEKSKDYNIIKNEEFVVKKYSWKYYYLLYRCNNIISTEAPLHVNILRSNNKILRKNIYKKKHVFLQHGIIYMKNLSESAFAKNREAEPNYIIASSKKEEKIINEQLLLKNVLITGLALYDKIKYNSINNNSKDIVTIMLTYKPYEEHLLDFEESSYYKNVVNIYGILTNYISKDNIRIIAHPKADKLLKSTSLSSSIFNGNISTCLEDTKLLITDYSSICYNAFYRGSGIIFYQNDINYYENIIGKLIPKENEFIGYRAFDDDVFNKILKQGIINNKINLDYYRTKEMIDIYKTINEFNDGNNANRIYDSLKGIKIL